MIMQNTWTRRRANYRIAFLSASLGTAVALADNRSYDGSNNNLSNATWGAAGTDLIRRSQPAYSDGLSALARALAPNPRDISNAIAAQTTSLLNSRSLSDMAWQWGQFVDHDLDLTNLGTETSDIPTSAQDTVFHGVAMGFSRSVFDPATGLSGPRQQVNAITSYLDGSMIYGSDPSRAAALRTFTGGHLLSQSTPVGELLPFNTQGLNMGALPGTDPTLVFLAGDGRANEQPGLTAMQTLFMREHNRQADLIAAANPSWNDEEIYQLARKIVGAEIQKITYSDWLPALLGPGRLSTYQGYNPAVNPTIATEFSAAAFRIGHSMLNGTLLRLDNNGVSIPQGGLPLRNNFFTPAAITDEGGISPLLKGLASQPAQEIDLHIVDDVREFLFGPFGPPGSIGFDLASLNIQRGRDHGLCDYNSMRVAYALPPVTSFAQITSNASAAALLQSVYGSISQIDPWIGMLAEDHVPGGSAGALMTAVIVDQFQRTRDGDRFWYQNDSVLVPYLNAINSATLSSIIQANTDITNIQSNAFMVVVPVCRADFNQDGAVTVADIFQFLSAWFARDSRADFNGFNGVTVQDIFDFLTAWFAGCH